MIKCEDKKGIIFIRATSIVSDSRVTKEADAALKGGYKVFILGWNREKKQIDTSKLQLNNGVAGIKLFNVKCGYGDGLKNLPKLLMFQFWILFQLFIMKKQYSIIHSCDFDTVIPCFAIKKITNKRLIYDIFDYYIHSHNVPSILENLVERIDIGIINGADAVLICNESRYKQIGKSTPKLVEVIHNTPNLDFIKNTPNICKSSNEKFKIVYVGILQNGRLLIEISDLIKNYNSIELHIGGFGRFEEHFDTLSKELDNVYYYGQLSYSMALRLESECDVLFATYDPKIPNHKFSAPNKIYEAMALSKPIVVCNKTGVDEIINIYNMGVSIEYKAEKFFDAMLLLEKNINMRIDMGENGRRAYDEQFSWGLMEKRLLSLYSKL